MVNSIGGGLPVHPCVPAGTNSSSRMDDGIGTHGWDEVFENLAVFVVGRVVEDGSEMVRFGPCACTRGAFVIDI